MVSIPILSNLDDLAAAIADPPPTRPYERAVGEFGRQVCDRWSAAADPGPGGYPGLVGTVCGPYLEGLGYSQPVEAPPPFTGGQCPVEYFTQYARPGAPTNWLSTSPDRLQGPISTATVVNSGPGPSGTTAWQVTFTGANGSSFGASNNNDGPPGIITRVVRVDGQADNCGDPESPGFEPGPNPAPDPGPLPPDSGPDIDIRGNPILVLPPNFSINPNFDIGFNVDEIRFGGGGGGLSDEPPAPGEELPGPNDGAGGADDEFGPPPDGERWCGVCIKISQRPIGSGLIVGSDPYDVYPTVVGNARLLFAGSTISGVDTSVRIQGKDTCLWEPVIGLRPTGVFVNLLPGFTYTRTPYSVPDETT